MLDNIILLTGPVEEAALAGALRNHNPSLAIHPVKSLPELEAIDSNVLRDARLIAFVTPVVVPPRILNALGFGAYNFHPGPPHYPGWVPAHFALYDRATMFGATVHVMIEKIDAGPIVAATLFPIPPDVRIQDLEALAFGQLARLFWQMAATLATQTEPIRELPIQWSGRKSTRGLYAAMCDIPLDIAKEELERRIEVFGAGHFGVFPTIRFYGHQFRYLAPDPADKGV
ncbi:MAG TPA: formyltransferase family protein [Pseudolabrys sp.]|nr:formyltransferase family protein [Pseudolabrys sp.]